MVRFIRAVQNDFLDPMIVQNFALKDVQVANFGPVFWKGFETHGFGIEFNGLTTTGILARPNEIQKGFREQITCQNGKAGHRVFGSTVIVMFTVIVVHEERQTAVVGCCGRKDLWMIGKDINGIEKFIVHDNFGMMVKHAAQEIGSRAFPCQDNKSLMIVALVVGPMKMCQESLTAILGLRPFHVQVQIGNTRHGCVSVGRSKSERSG